MRSDRSIACSVIELYFVRSPTLFRAGTANGVLADLLYLTPLVWFFTIAVRLFLGRIGFFDNVGSACQFRVVKQIFGHVRQLVDSLPYKEEVRGSSPFVPTNTILDFGFWILD